MTEEAAAEAEKPKGYDPRPIEAYWEQRWIELGVFGASEDPTDKRPRYVLPMPPPNVTGSLHMGHALFCTLEDILTRYHRMAGYCTLWQPGIDHAGIATQTVVERQLKRENLSRHDIGREAFLKRVWKWKAESGGRIAVQQRALGVSADWPRSKFTMDPEMSRGVREAFYRLHQEGLIYRDTRLVHWDCEAQTVLSNLEVDNEPAQGELFMFAYRLVDAAPDDEAALLVIATTRPETMLGDTAVAVHPDDERYKHLHGKRLQHPFVDRTIPVITDAELVDMGFGTGAVKVTPAHDFNDFATGKRHALEEINILTLDGKMNDKCGQFAGMDRFVARKAVKKALDEMGLSRGTKPHELMLPRSERSGSIVEPMISTQWFVKMKPLAEPALEAVRTGKTVIIPEEWAKTYDHFLTNILDWCISRQLWWGHRIPAYYCACGHINVTREETLAACEKCGGSELKQDEDVLDTWFSSGLWPFSTLGWPDQTDMLKKFYPASDLETGYDILFFWVARMMMMGIHFMGEPPFKRILLHGLVVDETGDKMSKVKGNVIDPLDLIYGADFDSVVQKALPGAPIEEALKKFKKAYPSAAQMGGGFPAFGADALRFTLASYSPQAKRIALSPKKIEGYRHFCNKLWNATRFALTYLEGVQIEEAAPAAKTLAPRWILSRLAATVNTVKTGIDEFRLDESTQAVYRFFWNELCDWYVELCKPIFASGDEAAKEEARAALAYTLEASLRLLHPFIPFITEELWHKVPRPPGSPESIVIARFPDASTGRADQAAETDMDVVQAVITAARTIRSEHGVRPAAEIEVSIRTDDDARRDLLRSEMISVRTLMKTKGSPDLSSRGGPRPAGAVMSTTHDVDILVSLIGLVDGDKEAERVEREIKKVEKDTAALEKKLALPSFADKAPKEVVQESHALLGELKRRRISLEEARSIASELGKKQ